jgi:phage major head subunit gpT-like protein
MKAITTAKIREVTAGFQTTFNKTMQETASDWSKVAMKTFSSAAKEVYGWLENTFGMKELIGEINIESIKASSYELPNREFHDTKKVKEADLQRDNEGIYAPMFQMMGMGASRGYEELVFETLVRGFTQRCYTGKAFFATNHPTGCKNATFSNLGTKKFSGANFDAARVALRTVKAANDKPWGFGQKLLLVVSPKYETAAKHVLNDENTTGGETNPYRGAAELLVTSFTLENEDAWFLLEVGWPVKPLILQEEQAVAINSVNSPGDSYVMLNHEYLFQAYGRYNAGYGLPQMAWGSTGADAA